jgi:hypothetical protein
MELRRLDSGGDRRVARDDPARLLLALRLEDDDSERGSSDGPARMSRPASRRLFST